MDNTAETGEMDVEAEPEEQVDHEDVSEDDLQQIIDEMEKAGKKAHVEERRRWRQGALWETC